MFEDLTIDQKRLIVRLPYRIGLYVSEADQSGGDESDAKEKQTLSNIIHGFACDVMGAEAIQHVISATLALAEQWNEWGDNLETVPAECVECVLMMEDHVGIKDARAFAVQMYEIGEAVALAFQEYEEGSFIEEMKLRFAHWQDQKLACKAGLREKSFEEYKSVSVDERQALSMLAKGLGLTEQKAVKDS